jgi:hypothetical protein
MPPFFGDDQWDDLLDFVEQGKVIPIVGEASVTFSDEDRPLYPWLATELAGRLSLPPEMLPDTPTVSSVAQIHLAQGGERNQIYSRLHRILKDPALTPGATLRQLCEVEAFRLVLTTTFDPLLERAMDAAQNGTGGRPLVAAFFPGASQKDLPARMADLHQKTLYHLLGRVSVAAGEFVALEEDLLDFLSELPRHLGTDVMRNLSADLRSQALLAIGMNFSDWIVRLLLRIARQDSLSRVSLHSWLAEGPPQNVCKSMVLFFGGISKSIQVVECDPPAFVAELARRWRERRPAHTVPHGSGNPASSASLGGYSPGAGSSAPAGLVFLSYAREDEAAARRIKARLEAAGCAVYFDRERLGPGMNFHYQLEDQVSRYCALFVSVVSEFTESAIGDNYFRRERFWASERAKSFSDIDREEFYLPFLVHERKPTGLQHEPRIFSGCQWNMCPGGEMPDGLAASVSALQRKFRSRTPGS